MASVQPRTHVQPTPTSRRRSTRRFARIPLRLALGEGDPIPAVTRNISQHGALVLAPATVQFPSVVWVQNRETSRRVQARVVRPPAPTAGAYELALEFLDREDSFWGPDYDACLGPWSVRAPRPSRNDGH